MPKVVKVLEEMGFVISQKSVINPVVSLDFIGYQVDESVYVKEATVNKVITKFKEIILNNRNLSHLNKYLGFNIEYKLEVI